jgi:hypothetical protein
MFQGMSPQQAGAVKAAFDQAFMSGFHAALIIGGCVLLVAAVVANRFVPGRTAAGAEVQRVEAREPAVVEL